MTLSIKKNIELEFKDYLEHNSEEISWVLYGMLVKQ